MSTEVTVICFSDDEELSRFSVYEGSFTSMRHDALKECPVADKIEIYEYGFTWVLKDKTWNLHNPDWKLI
jgi:hypothetical protein